MTVWRALRRISGERFRKTAAAGGIIESDVVAIPAMQNG